VVSELSERADLMALVEEAGNAWSARAPIHGDVKWDNVLARREPSGAWRLWLIDWELAGWGDPGWDVAGLAETIVTTQLLAGGAIDPARSGRSAAPPLPPTPTRSGRPWRRARTSSPASPWRDSRRPSCSWRRWRPMVRSPRSPGRSSTWPAR
jgi:aminoglycoside phosphotransferase (APT) family kinase protein